MPGVIYQSNGDVVTKYVSDSQSGAVFEQSMQECADIINSCAKERAADTLRGHRKTGAFKCVAELPIVLVDSLKAQGLDVMNDREALRKVLNDPAFSAFRCSVGKV